MENNLTNCQDLEDIMQLRENDIAASRARNYQVLRTLVSNDAIILPAGEKPIQGILQLDEWFSQMEKSMQDIEILEYSMEFQEIHIQGEFAFEWGYSHGAMRNTRSGEIQRSTFKLLRVLRRENKQWKVYRSIWNQ